MTCITIENRKGLQKQLADDGTYSILAMLERVGVMDSIQSKLTLKTKLSPTLNLSSVIIANSYEDLDITVENAEEVGDSLKQLLNLSASPISIDATTGQLVFANNFKAVQEGISEVISDEFVKTETAFNEVSDPLIMAPIISRENERLQIQLQELRDVREKKEALLKTDNPDKAILKSYNDRITNTELSIQRLRDYMKHLDAFPNLKEVYKKFDIDSKMATALMSKENLTWDELTELKRLVQLWKGITSQSVNLLKLDNEHEWGDDDIKLKLASMGQFFNTVDGRLALKEVKAIIKKSKEELGEEGELTREDITQMNKDENWLNSRFRGLSRSEVPIIRLIAKIISKANDAALSAFKTVEKTIDDSYDAVSDIIGTDFDIFFAKDKNGNNVGQLVSRFTFEFWDTIKSAKKSKSKSGREWLKNNTMVIQFQYLYDDASEVVPAKYRISAKKQEMKDKFQKQLLDALGEDGYQEYMDNTSAIVKDYFKSRDSLYNVLSDSEGNMTDEANLEFRKWDEYHSPFKQSNHGVNFQGKGTDGKFLKINNDLILRIPLRVNKLGKETNFYDTNFADIEANEDLKAFHKTVSDVIADARLSYNYKFGTNPNALPYLEKALASQITDNGWNVTGAFKMGADMMKNSLDGKDADDSHIELDEMGEITTMHINKGVTTIDAKARQIHKFDAIEFEQENGRAPNARENVEIMRQAYVKAGEKQDMDLVKLVKLLAMNSTAYKHKSMVKGEVELMTSVFKKNADKDVNNNMTNAIEFLENTLKADFYGKSTKQMEGELQGIFGGKGTLTSENRRKVALLEFEIDKISKSSASQETKDSKKAELEQQILDLHGKVYASEIARGFLNYARILGIGWNLISSTTNLMFGQIGNFQRAIQGDHFGIQDIKEATMLTMGNDRIKVENISHKLGLVGDQSYSLKKQGQKETSRFAKAKNILNPYALQTASEGLNQKPIMVAIMKNTYVTTIDGENKSNLYDILDENGEIDTDYYGDDSGLNGNELLADVMFKVRQVVGETHGDYTSTLLANNKAFFQSLLMFRRWLAEMLVRRWGKGGLFTTTFKVIGDLVTKKRTMDDITDEEKGKVKAALIGDVGLALLVLGASMLGKALLCDKKDCKDAPPVVMGIMNLLKRLEDEISFFYMPSSAFDMIKDPITGSRVLLDLFKFGLVAPYAIDDDSKAAYYRSGRYKGENKAKVAFWKLVPAGNQIQRFWNYGDEPTYTKDWGSYFNDKLNK